MATATTAATIAPTTAIAGTPTTITATAITAIAGMAIAITGGIRATVTATGKGLRGRPAPLGRSLALKGPQSWRGVREATASKSLAALNVLQAVRVPQDIAA